MINDPKNVSMNKVHSNLDMLFNKPWQVGGVPSGFEEVTIDHLPVVESQV